MFSRHSKGTMDVREVEVLFVRVSHPHLSADQARLQAKLCVEVSADGSSHPAMAQRAN